MIKFILFYYILLKIIKLYKKLILYTNINRLKKKYENSIKYYRYFKKNVFIMN